MKRIVIILSLILCLTVVITQLCFAADRYFDANWSLNPGYMTDFGFQRFPHDLRVHEAANYSGNNIVMFYHECNAFWYPQYYGANTDLWYTVKVGAKYKSGTTTVGSLWWYDWTAMSWILPLGKEVYGGYNSDDFSLSRSQTCKGEYTTTVDCNALWAPVVETKSITFS